MKETTERILLFALYLCIITSTCFLAYKQGESAGMNKLCDGTLGIDKEGTISCYPVGYIKNQTITTNTPPITFKIDLKQNG